MAPIAQNIYSFATGMVSTTPYITILKDRDPTQFDLNYPLTQRWVNTSNNKEWFLKNFVSTSGQVLADWILFNESNTSGINWIVVTTDQLLTPNTGYFANGAGLLFFNLPLTSSVGDTYEIVAMNGNGFHINQQAGQSIQLGTSSTTVGVGGSVQSIFIGDHIRLVCNVANTSWFGLDAEGNLTVT